VWKNGLVGKQILCARVREVRWTRRGLEVSQVRWAETRVIMEEEHALELSGLLLLLLYPHDPHHFEVLSYWSPAATCNPLTPSWIPVIGSFQACLEYHCQLLKEMARVVGLVEEEGWQALPQVGTPHEFPGWRQAPWSQHSTQHQSGLRLQQPALR